LATAIWLWFQLVGFHAVVLWQLMQFTAVGIWVPVLPVAPLPLWQLEQLVAEVNRLWSGLDADQMLVDLWQLSHEDWPLWMAVAGRPVTPKLVLMWQVEHWPDTATLL
jgi:hypothetical protein